MSPVSIGPAHVLQMTRMLLFHSLITLHFHLLQLQIFITMLTTVPMHIGIVVSDLSLYSVKFL